jgi:DNA sulfur modification protein DndB
MKTDQLSIPAMRGAMGDWVFYVTLLPFYEVIKRIKKTDEIHPSKLLKEMIQRALTPRSKKIADYLKTQKQRFFNAIVVGVYDGAPEWNRLNIKKTELFDPSNMEPRVSESLGILTLRGDEKLFAIDGQHRVEGIKEFGKEISELSLKQSEDEICAIFVSHNNTPSGIQRTRRLFSTLNRYAKPVNLKDIIALDEDDVVAITCRSLLEEHPLFKNGRISLEMKKSLPPTDRINFTSLISLYNTMDIYLMVGNKSSWQKFKSFRPNDETIQEYIKKAHSFWDSLMNKLPELKDFSNLKDDDMFDEKYRNINGGNLIFRPIAPPIVSRCLRNAIKFNMSEDAFLTLFSKIPQKLQEPPWLHILWDGENMITSKKNQKLAEDVILWMVNCDPSEKKFKSDDIKRRLSSTYNFDISEVTLPGKVK